MTERSAVPDTNKPIRIRLFRKRGWRMPKNTVCVARPGRFGNPFKVGAIDHRGGRAINAASAVARFAESLMLGRLAVSEMTVRRELRGKNLACWCPLDQPCHADVLLDVANAPICEEVRP